jgi:ADP-ribosyl-[dinitrogen reductase] hydrolase
MRLTPFAVWAHKLPKEELFLAVKLQTMMTHSNEIAIEASQLYCYAISLLIKGYSTSDTVNMTKNEAKNETIKEWFDTLIETNDTTKLPLVNKNIGHLKIAFVWAFYYLKNNYSYSDAQYDILSRGGDTDTNAAIVGGLLGAAYGDSAIDSYQKEKMLVFDPEIHGGQGRPEFLKPKYGLL